MKKLLTVITCISLLSVIAAPIVSAQENKAGTVPEIIDTFEKFGGTAVSLFSRFFNKIKKTDEGNIQKPSEFTPSYKAAPEDYVIENPESEISTETWVMTEIKLTGTKKYTDPFRDVDVDLILTGNGRRYTVPGFWDGGSEWKVRFVCPSAGTWYFETVCTDAENEGLNGRTGVVNCGEYSGSLDIYKNGFVTTASGKKYFTYDNGEPFLYLGDTHWSLGDETTEMVEIISRHRAEQGYTVWQSEPIGEVFDLTDGVTEADMDGLRNYDEKFRLIAEAGLVHANAEFFFPSYMQILIERNGGVSGKKIYGNIYELSGGVKSYLEKLTRYWVARYGAFPVMWTLGQEVDNDFYWAEDNHAVWDYHNNPYKLAAEYIEKYDCYDHPLSAHQEHSGATAAYGNGRGTGEKLTVYRPGAQPSAFRDVKAHNWYAAQWSPSKTEQSNYEVEKDYWYNSQGKPSIDYEGQYCFLWTKNFGSRMQGWCAYLNGFYGYGWGGHDTWSYTNIYDEENDSSDGVDTVTSQEKINATWQDSLEYPSSYQCGYMLDFLGKIKWYELIPRFDNKSYFKSCSNVFYCMASNKDNSEGVVYFYSFTDNSIAAKSNTKRYGGIMTGTLGNLIPGKEYKYKWFNPVTNELSEEQTFTASRFGTYYIGSRQDCGKTVDCDMVFCYY